MINHNNTNGIPRPLRPPRRLRIAQIAPLFESVPPKMYGGTERVVSHLTEVIRKHLCKSIRIFLSRNWYAVVMMSHCSVRQTAKQAPKWSFMSLGKSQSPASGPFKFIPCSRPAFRLNPVMDIAIPYQWMMEQVRQRADEFDILVCKLTFPSKISLHFLPSIFTQWNTSPFCPIS
jgi:hypothetical protein